MPVREFQSWKLFYKESPFDDHHRFHRPAVLVSSSMSRGNAKDKFEFLVPTPIPDDMTSADMTTLAAFGLTPPANNE
ncbi:hypothetical protein [Orrella sp. 11846]|uniref:hypothetical protein n=1 Tax=Orrella sp. 11846 TaxID=3409913 RepID=UPI003B5CA2A5